MTRAALTRFDADAIPAELRAIKRWTLWRPRPRPGGGWGKAPCDERGRLVAAECARLGLDEAVRLAREKGYGIGLWFSGDGLVGIDLDHCVKDGVLSPDAAAVVQDLDSYCELSPSGAGVRIIVRGRVEGRGKRGKLGDGSGLEVYPDGQFLTITGNRIHGEGVEQRQAALDRLCAHLPERPPARPHRAVRRVPPVETDAELIDTMMRSEKGSEIAQLWAGGGSNQSDADFHLCRHLAFWTRSDTTAIDRLFRQSARMRSKWDERRGAMTYGERTVLRAMDVLRIERNQTRMSVVVAEVMTEDGPELEPMTVAELAARLFASRHVAYRLLLDLERAGRARREQDPLNRRAQSWAITREGWRLLSAADDAYARRSERERAAESAPVEKIEDPQAWLRSELAHGSRHAAELKAAAALGGVSPKRLRTAREALGVCAQRIPPTGRVKRWEWSLPEGGGQPAGRRDRSPPPASESD